MAVWWYRKSTVTMEAGTRAQTHSLTRNLRCFTYSKSLLLWDQGSKTTIRQFSQGHQVSFCFWSWSLSSWNGHRTSSQTHPLCSLLALSALISFCTSCGSRALLGCTFLTSDYWKQERKGAGAHRLWGRLLKNYRCWIRREGSRHL